MNAVISYMLVDQGCPMSKSSHDILGLPLSSRCLLEYPLGVSFCDDYLLGSQELVQVRPSNIALLCHGRSFLKTPFRRDSRIGLVTF